MDNIVGVKVVDGLEDLLDGLRGVFFGELALVTDPVEQFAAGRKLCDDVELVLQHRSQIQGLIRRAEQTYPRLEPVDKFDNVGVAQPLEDLELVVDHLLVAFDALLQDDLDSDLAGWALGLANDAICSGAKSSTEPVSRSVR